MLRRLAWLSLLAAIAKAQSGLADQSLEQLLDTKVTSVSKKEQKLSKTAAAIFVINEDDIRRSGATNVPDVLRMAPGVDVARIDANSWAISIRGFNYQYSNKVLVLIDGRSVYTPSFSGVFWEDIDLPLEDIDRIEVIRGPGGTMWGANAVNGVINIINKTAKATKGARFSAGAGSDVRAQSLAQFGGDAGANGAYRIFGRYFDVGSSPLSSGPPGYDGWHRAQAGFRGDWDMSARDELTIEGDLFHNRMSETLRASSIPVPGDAVSGVSFDASGGSLLARWTHTSMSGTQTAVQSYYDSYRRTSYGVPEKMDTADFDFQQHVVAGVHHDIVWGAGFRTAQSSLPAGYSVSLNPPVQTSNLYSAFFQDEIQLKPAVWLTLGSKLEHNSYTGFEYEPSARLAWAPSSSSAFWASAARAIRQPSRTDVAVGVDLARIPIDAYTVEVIRLIGNPRAQAEEVKDFETGYRAQFSRTASLDVAGFLSRHSRLVTYEPGAPTVTPWPLPVQVLVPFTFENLASAWNYGGEAVLNWNATSSWKIISSYSFERLRFHLDPASRQDPSINAFGNSPEQMFQVRSRWDVTRNFHFDQSIAWTSGLSFSTLPAHTRVDVRLARKLGESVEASVTGQNLLRPSVAEFVDCSRLLATQAKRSVFGRLEWRF
jgi:iron complex outermembrane receptor protein